MTSTKNKKAAGNPDIFSRAVLCVAITLILIGGSVFSKAYAQKIDNTPLAAAVKLSNLYMNAIPQRCAEFGVTMQKMPQMYNAYFAEQLQQLDALVQKRYQLSLKELQKEINGQADADYTLQAVQKQSMIIADRQAPTPERAAVIKKRLESMDFVCMTADDTFNLIFDETMQKAYRKMFEQALSEQ